LLNPCNGRLPVVEWIHKEGKKEMANKEGNITWDDAGDYTWTVFLTKTGWRWLVTGPRGRMIGAFRADSEAAALTAVEQKMQELGVSMQR